MNKVKNCKTFIRRFDSAPRLHFRPFRFLALADTTVIRIHIDTSPHDFC
jgi:hypothetical protein